MEEKVEILLKTEKKPEVVEILQFLDEMTQEEQQEMRIFMQGMRFAKRIDRKADAKAAKPV